jgi:hypothetical protein
MFKVYILLRDYYYLAFYLETLSCVLPYTLLSLGSVKCSSCSLAKGSRS